MSDAARSHHGRARRVLFMMLALGAGWLILWLAGPPPGLAPFDPPPSPMDLGVPGELPITEGRTYRCRFASGYGAYLPERLFFPPNHPSRPPQTVRPEWCFATAADAKHAGYSLAPPPQGALVVGGVYLVPVDLGSQCELAGSALGLPVPCPAHLPNPGWRSEPPDCNRTPFQEPCVFDGAFVLDYPGFAVPPEYQGEGVEGPHLVVSAFDPDDPEGRWLGCPGSELVSSMRLWFGAGRAATAQLVVCPVPWLPHGGHLLLRWSEEGVSYQVSIHGHTDTNEALLAAVASSIVLVE